MYLIRSKPVGQQVIPLARRSGDRSRGQAWQPAKRTIVCLKGKRVHPFYHAPVTSRGAVRLHYQRNAAGASDQDCPVSTGVTPLVYVHERRWSPHDGGK